MSSHLLPRPRGPKQAAQGGVRRAERGSSGIADLTMCGQAAAARLYLLTHNLEDPYA